MLIDVMYENPRTHKIETKKMFVEDDFFKEVEAKGLNKPDIEKDKLDLLIDSLDVSAELKILLGNIKDFTFKIGNTIINIGLKILDVLFYLMKKFPNATIGALVGFVIGTLIASIPWIGWLLAWVPPVLVSIGFVVGVGKDIIGENFTSSDVGNFINNIFSPLGKAKETKS